MNDLVREVVLIFENKGGGVAKLDQFDILCGGVVDGYGLIG